MGRPGKFEGGADSELAKRLYRVTLESGCDAEFGDCTEYGLWCGLIIGKPGEYPDSAYVLTEDSQGFFDYLAFGDTGEARAVFAQAEEEYLAWSEQPDSV